MFNSLGKNPRPSMVSPLNLAIIGDTVYDLYIRTKLVNDAVGSVGKVHNLATGYVCAASQAKGINGIVNMLSEDEILVFKRGRNAKSHTTPKNADLIEYKSATGFETLIGFLYLSGEFERIDEIIFKVVEIIDGK